MLASALLLVGGCGVSERSLGSDQASASADGGGGAACQQEGATGSCTCDGRRGVRVCRRGQYGACDCRDPDEGLADGELACRAGYYVGEFSGSYRPGVFGLGVLGSGLPFDIAGGPSGSRPGLSFTLEDRPNGVAGEFATFSVGNGCMVGIAKAVGTNNPFVAKLTGDVDCSTGAFEGVLEGYYTLLSVPGANFKFSGPITAQFEVDEARLRDGAWSVMEPPALNGDPAGGGSGTWSAVLQGPLPPSDVADPCKSIIAGEVAPGDAGVSAPSAGEASTGGGSAVRDVD